MAALTKRISLFLAVTAFSLCGLILGLAYYFLSDGTCDAQVRRQPDHEAQALAKDSPKIPPPACYERLEIGMSPQEVRNIMGEPWTPKESSLRSDFHWKTQTPPIIQRSQAPFARKLKTGKGPLFHEKGRVAETWYDERWVILVIFQQDKMTWKDIHLEDGTESGPYILILQAPPADVDKVNHMAHDDKIR